MKTRQLYTWQFFVGAFIGGFTCFILGAVLATFLYMKNLDVAGIREDHEYLKKQYEMLKKEQVINNNISDYIDEVKAMTKWNEEAIEKPGEGK